MEKEENLKNESIKSENEDNDANALDDSNQTSQNNKEDISEAQDKTPE